MADAAVSKTVVLDVRFKSRLGHHFADERAPETLRFRSSFCIAAQARAGQRRPAAAVRQLRHARRLTQTRRNGIGPGARKPGAPCGQRRFVYNSRRAAGNCLLPTALEPALAVRILFWARFVPLLGRSGFFFRPRLKISEAVSTDRLPKAAIKQRTRFPPPLPQGRLTVTAHEPARKKRRTQCAAEAALRAKHVSNSKPNECFT